MCYRYSRTRGVGLHRLRLPNADSPWGRVPSVPGESFRSRHRGGLAGWLWGDEVRRRKVAEAKNEQPVKRLEKIASAKIPPAEVRSRVATGNNDILTVQYPENTIKTMMDFE